MKQSDYDRMLKKRYKSFLENQEALAALYIGLRRDKYRFSSIGDEDMLDDFMKHNSPRQYINHAFGWSGTHEGHSFWEVLDIAWRNKVIRYDESFENKKRKANE